MQRRLLLTGLISALLIIALLIMTATTAAGQSTRSVYQPDRVLVVRLYFSNRADLVALSARLDVWAVYSKENYLEAGITPTEYLALLAQGYRVEIDLNRTITLNQPRVLLPDQTTGIPGYPCYRTVEETYATAQSIVNNHPTLAQWIDIGDSWEKVSSGGQAGYDLRVLKLTNQNTPGPKPKFFVMASMHAREYAPAELTTRFAEYLIDNYGVDPDVTWLLDYTEIHLLLQANPDGRKIAETGVWWRKNTNSTYCSSFPSNYGADLNRNYPFQWGGSGSSGNECDETYRGPSAASEPETQAVISYVQSLYPVLRPDDLTTPAPLTTTGMFMDLHSYSELVLWPWGFTYDVPPNGTALQTLGRKFAYFNNYTPQQSIGLYPTDGTTDDFAYGTLGVPAFTFEMGTAFFQDCAAFENTIVPANLPALLYAAKAARRPYQTTAGPDVLNVGITPITVTISPLITLTATADDTRYNNSNGVEPTQIISATRYSIDAPSWITTTYPVSATDGSFDNAIESLRITIDTTGWTIGRHLIFVESQDAAGNWGVPTAAFVWINPPLDKHFYLPLLAR